MSPVDRQQCEYKAGPTYLGMHSIWDVLKTKPNAGISFLKYKQRQPHACRNASLHINIEHCTRHGVTLPGYNSLEHFWSGLLSPHLPNRRQRPS